MSTPTSQQFEGKTIEEALAAAVDTLGDDLEVLDAQRVRRRRALGLRRKERYEVTASKRSLAEPRDFEEVLKRMADRVDEAERQIGSPAAEDRRWWKNAEFVIPEAEGDQPSIELPPDIEVDVRHEPAIASGGSPIVADLTVTQAIRTEAPTITVEEEQFAPAWSIDALRSLDLPSAMLDRLPKHLKGDLVWVEALASAIGDLLETAEFVSGSCELTGHGAESAVQLIRGACDGFRLDSLIIDGRRLPATPLELALAIRSLLREPVA